MFAGYESAVLDARRKFLTLLGIAPILYSYPPVEICQVGRGVRLPERVHILSLTGEELVKVAQRVDQHRAKLAPENEAAARGESEKEANYSHVL